MKELDIKKVLLCTTAIQEDDYIKQCLKELHDFYKNCNPKIVYCLIKKDIEYRFTEEEEKHVSRIKYAIQLRTEQLESYYLK